MTDFYKELGDFLNPQMSQQEILTELKKQKAIWHRREITGGDQAKAKSLLINQALEVFATEESRKKYDKELEESKREEPQSQVEKVDYEKEREENFLEWANKAIQFLEMGQYDLAQDAFETAEKHVNPKKPNLPFYNLGVEIYDRSNKIDRALYWMNQILLHDPENPSCYMNKALFLFKRGKEYQHQGMYNEAEKFQGEGIQTAGMAEKFARKRNDNVALGKAIGVHSFMLLFQEFNYMLKDADYIALEERANLALQLVPEEDYAKTVLQELKSRGLTKEQIDEKNRKIEAEKEEARKNAEEEEKKKRKRENFLSAITIIHVSVMLFMCIYVYKIHTEFPLTKLLSERYSFEQIFGAKWMVFFPGVCMLVSRLTDWLACTPETEFIHAIDIILYLVAGYYLNIISIIPYGITYDKDGVVYALLLNGCLLALPLLILGISTMIRNFIADKSGFNRRY